MLGGKKHMANEVKNGQFEKSVGMCVWRQTT